MAHSGKVIENPKTRQRLTFMRTAQETGGELLEFEVAAAGGGADLPDHVHPEQVESIEVVDGAVRLRLNGDERLLGPGDAATVPAGAPHSWACVGDSATETRVRVVISPAANAETFLETMYGLSRDGKTNAKGMPKPLQMAVLAHAHRHEMAFAGPPVAVQRAFLGILAPLGRLAGYRARYARYSD
jgi:quercetin dioxygenase-like cupin family protein